MWRRRVDSSPLDQERRRELHVWPPYMRPLLFSWTVHKCVVQRTTSHVKGTWVQNQGLTMEEFRSWHVKIRTRKGLCRVDLVSCRFWSRWPGDFDCSFCVVQGSRSTNRNVERWVETRPRSWERRVTGDRSPTLLRLDRGECVLYVPGTVWYTGEEFDEPRTSDGTSKDQGVEKNEKSFFSQN